MSQVCITTAMTTTPPVTVVSYGMSSLSLVTMAPSLMGLPTMLGQHDVILSPSLTPKCSGSALGLAFVPQQQTPSSMPLQAYANYAMTYPQAGFFVRVEHPTVLYIICLVPVLVSAFYFQVPYWMPYSPLGPHPLGFAPLQPLGVYPWQACVQPGDGHWPTPGMHRVDAPSTTWNRGEPYATGSAVPQPFHLYDGAYSFGGLAESPIPPPSLHGGKWSSFPGLVPSNDMFNSESAIGIKPGDYGVVIGYQVDEFAHTWSAEWFVAHSHIYPGFSGKLSLLTHFPWYQVVRIILFWTRLLLTLNKAWIPSSLILLRHQYWTLPGMRLMPLHLQFLVDFFTWLVLFLIIINCSLLLA